MLSTIDSKMTDPLLTYLCGAHAGWAAQATRREPAAAERRWAQLGWAESERAWVPGGGREQLTNSALCVASGRAARGWAGR
jgi:hypothetical protein